MARQTFLAAKPSAGETINNLLFVCRNSKNTVSTKPKGIIRLEIAQVLLSGTEIYWPNYTVKKP